MQINMYQNKIMVFNKPIDFRKSITGLVTTVESVAGLNSKEGIFVFYNKARDKLKLLSWHKNGFILLYKSLADTKFPFIGNLEGKSLQISIEELGWLLAGLEWQKMRNWGELNYNKFS